MAKPVVEIILKATDKASKVFKATGKDAKSMGKDIAKMGVAFAGTAAAAVIAGKQIWEFGKSGAAVAQTGESFDLLTEKVGLSSDLLEQLQDASKGTISDMELMSSTSLLLAGAQGELALALGESTPQLLEIAKAAQKLNPALGDTTFLYDSLARGIKRASPLILDNLGLVISVADANEKYAASIGKSVDQLTVEEQKMALLNDTLRAGKVLIDQVGGSTDSMADSFSRAEASIKNASDALKKKYVPEIAKAADWINEYFEFQELTTLGMEELNEEVVRLSSSYEDYIVTMVAVLVANEELTLAESEAIGSRLKHGEAIDDLIMFTGMLQEEEVRGIWILEELATRYGILSTQTEAVIEPTLSFTEAMGGGIAGMSTMLGVANELGMSYDFAATRAGMMAESIRISSETMEEAERKKLALKLATENLTDAERLGLIQGQQELERIQQLLTALDEGAISWDTFTEATLDGETTQEDFNKAMGLTEDAIISATPVLDDLSGTMVILEEDVGDAASQTKRLIDFIRMLRSKSITISVDFDVGAMPSFWRPPGTPVGPQPGGPGPPRPYKPPRPVGGTSVEAPGTSGAAMEGSLVINNQFFDQGAAAIGMAEMERISADNFNSFMGG